MFDSRAYRFLFSLAHGPCGMVLASQFCLSVCGQVNSEGGCYLVSPLAFLSQGLASENSCVVDFFFPLLLDEAPFDCGGCIL